MIMKKYLIILFAAMAAACVQTGESVDWKAYNVGKIIFEDQAKETEGSKIYARIIKDPEAYIAEQARDVLATLYFSPADSIPPVENIYYTLEDVDGISAKDGEGEDAYVFYSTRHIEQSFTGNNVEKVLFETRGVLLHELTHVYQLSPQGIGGYDDDRAALSCDPDKIYGRLLDMGCSILMTDRPAQVIASLERLGRR